MTTTRKRSAPAQAAAPTLPDVRLVAPSSTVTELGIDLGTWRVLTESIFPSARTPEGVLLAVRYCRARKLDIMRRPVHVVPMWSKALGREVETVWPGIAEQLMRPADMHDDTALCDFPELSDEAVIAINHFLEDFYTAFQNHYFAQIHRWYQRQPPDDDQLPLPLNSTC